MVHVDYFLHSFQLETGGKVIAWLHIVGYSILIVALLAGFAVVATRDDDKGDTVIDKNKIVAFDYGPSDTFLLILVALAVIVCVITIVIACRSLNAIRTRNHTRMFEMMAMMFSLTCFFIYVLFIQLWLWPMQCLATVIVVVVYYYIFIVVYSHYRMFRKEYEQKLILQQKA